MTNDASISDLYNNLVKDIRQKELMEYIIEGLSNEDIIKKFIKNRDLK